MVRSVQQAQPDVARCDGLSAFEWHFIHFQLVFGSVIFILLLAIRQPVIECNAVLIHPFHFFFCTIFQPFAVLRRLTHHTLSIFISIFIPFGLLQSSIQHPQALLISFVQLISTSAPNVVLHLVFLHKRSQATPFYMINELLKRMHTSNK